MLRQVVLLCVVVAATARELRQAQTAEDLPLAVAEGDLPVGKIGVPSESENEIIPGPRQVNNGTLRLQGCPPISEIPIANDELTDFFGARIYDGSGGSVATTSCNGNPHDLKSGYMTRNPIKAGSMIVHAGCTLHLFMDDNYQDEFFPGLWDGPFSIYDSYGLFFGIKSMIVECEQTMPNCDPEDAWQGVAYLDNTGYSTPSDLTYKRTIGTSWSSQISQGFSVDVSVEYTIKASFFDLFGSESSINFSTGYDWSKIDSQSMSEETTVEITTTVEPGKILLIEQAQGFCAGSNIKTIMYRNIDVETGEYHIFYA